jgi:hypothetical protein
MAPAPPTDQARPARYVFDSTVELMLSRMRANEAREKAAKAARVGERGVALASSQNRI